MSDIHVIDDFFSNEIREVIFDKMLRPKWSFSGGGDGNVFWHQDGLEEEEYFSTYLYNIICTKIGRKFKNILRIYANGQTAGQCGNPHVDDGDITILYYPNPHWQMDYQGHLVFSEDGNAPTHIIEYKPNRMVMFHAKTLHYSEAPHRFYQGLRVSLAYKLEV